MVAYLPRRALLPALGAVGLALVVMAPLTFGAGGLLGGGGARVVPTTGTGAPICLLACPEVRLSAAPSPATATTAANAASPSSPASAPAASRPSGPAGPNTAARAPSGPAPAPTTGPGPSATQPVDQVTNGLPIVPPALPLSLPPVVPPGAPS